MDSNPYQLSVPGTFRGIAPKAQLARNTDAFTVRILVSVVFGMGPDPVVSA